MTPLPTTWLGRQPKGWVQTILLTSAVDQFEHLTGQEPALAGLVSERDDILGIFCQVLNVGRRREVTAGLEALWQRASRIHSTSLDAHVG